MSEEIEKKLTISDMIRLTSENTHNFLNQVADHIERLEATVNDLSERLEQVEKSNEN